MLLTGVDGDARPPLVEVRGIGKRYAGIDALKQVGAVVEAGTVHALVGENGAGKSTLGKVIGGVVRPDSGQVIVDGRPVNYAAPKDALADGIAYVAQELELVPQLTVAANVLLGIEPRSALVVSRRRARLRVRELIAESDFDLDVDSLVADLGTAQRQQVEILRAIARDSRLIVMDEPTAALTLAETEKLHSIVRTLRDQGTAVVYVSHFLEEILALADTVTVLRSGTLIRTGPVLGETAASLLTSMLGREVDTVFPPVPELDRDAPVVLSVRGLKRTGVLDDISFDVRRGEIVGVAGLVGSGRSEVLRAIFGVDSVDSGGIEVDGRALNPKSPRDAWNAGVVLVPEDRKLQGLVMGLAVSDNLTLPHLSQLSTAGVVRTDRMQERSDSMIDRLSIATRSGHTSVEVLSGGNQQKVLFGKCLMADPDIVLLDEPTRGVDVGAKLKIYELIRAIAARGRAVVVVSSELEEVIGLAHRVLVMRRGAIVREFEREELSIEAVMRSAFGAEGSAPTQGVL